MSSGARGGRKAARVWGGEVMEGLGAGFRIRSPLLPGKLFGPAF
jgi:hypothetical protein